MRKDTEKPVDIAVMSDAMKKSLKSKIAQWGFESTDYEKFLKSVLAMKDHSITAFPESEIESYRERYVKQHEKGLNDMFVFEKWAKVDNGFFYPRLFWDKVLAS